MMEAMEAMEEMYSFHDYIVDRKLLATQEPTLQDEEALWSFCADDYKEYCRENDYDFEELPE